MRIIYVITVTFDLFNVIKDFYLKKKMLFYIFYAYNPKKMHYDFYKNI